MWTPGGKIKRGRPKTTLRKTFLNEGATMGCNTIQDLHLLATDRTTWRIKTSEIEKKRPYAC